MHVFNKYRLTPCISYTTEEDHAAIAMVESGLGVSMLNRLSTGGIQTRAVEPLSELTKKGEAR